MFKKLFQLIEDLNIAIGKCVSFLIWAGIAVLCFEVVARYGFSQPTTWAHGYTQRIFGSYFVLVGAYTLIKREHVRVDILLLPGRVRWNAFLDLINLAFLLLWGRCSPTKAGISSTIPGPSTNWTTVFWDTRCGPETRSVRRQLPDHSPGRH